MKRGRTASARDPDALALAAAELVWIAARRVGRQADEGEKLVDARAALAAGAETVDRESLADDARDPHARIQ